MSLIADELICGSVIGAVVGVSVREQEPTVKRWVVRCLALLLIVYAAYVGWQRLTPKDPALFPTDQSEAKRGGGRNTNLEHVRRRMI